ncbi:TetR/AcrR family transcriptional regulator [Enterococcus alishanensis]
MPRSLTEQEKEMQRQLLLKHGKELSFRYGISRVSVDDIVKDAGVAKGSFYNYFSSKDDFLYQLIFQIHEEGFAEVNQLIEVIGKLSASEKRAQIKRFFLALMNDPKQRFLLKERQEVENFLARHSKDSFAEIEKMEINNYQKIIAKLSLGEKNPFIIQNYIHIIFFGVSHKELLFVDYIDATVEVMLDGLLNYLEL